MRLIENICLNLELYIYFVCCTCEKNNIEFYIPSTLYFIVSYKVNYASCFFSVKVYNY